MALSSDAHCQWKYISAPSKLVTTCCERRRCTGMPNIIISTVILFNSPGYHVLDINFKINNYHPNAYDTNSSQSIYHNSKSQKEILKISNIEDVPHENNKNNKNNDIFNRKNDKKFKKTKLVDNKSYKDIAKNENKKETMF
ncbi:hypothetical protein H8356DRAFT_1356145 [Neocallimastix lanati (nom. inval.)]|nr:hypothetical protein H8356DRAFT_1356145 [Neocallimastix sp. JGI-2020a]